MKVRYDAQTGKLGNSYPDSMLIPPPYITLSEDELNNIKNQTNKIAFVINNAIVLKDKAELEAEEKSLKEATRRAKLHMTKYDFFTYVCKPYGISYDSLISVINSNDDLKAAWELCNHVYRGNADLNAYILKVIPTLTEAKLNEIFEEHSEK